MSDIKPRKIIATDLKIGQVVRTDFGRSYITKLNVAKSSNGEPTFIIATFIVNDATERQSFTIDEEIEVLWDE